MVNSILVTMNLIYEKNQNQTQNREEKVNVWSAFRTWNTELQICTQYTIWNMTFIHETKSRIYATTNVQYAMMGITRVRCNMKYRMLVMRLQIIDIIVNSSEKWGEKEKFRVFEIYYMKHKTKYMNILDMLWSFLNILFYFLFGHTFKNRLL